MGCREFIKYMREEGEPRQLVVDAIRGLIGALHLQRSMGGVWKLYKAWQKAEPGTKSPPLLEDQL